jgi:hypothetical protein
VTLEEIIRAAAADGRLDRTSIVKDPAGRGWQVNTPSRFGQNAWAVEINADPVVALRDALEPYKAVAELSVDEMLE